jgi:WD40 repeat protein
MSQSPLIGTVLRSHYKILRRLGSGGFGDTYLAQDLDLPGQPQCVVKHLQPKDPNPAVLPIAKNLFDREAHTLYQLSNACSQIPRLFAHFEEQGEFYLVQEFVDGHDLTQEIILGQPKSEAIVLKLLKDILEILVVVHQHQAIHRDIKPPNIMRRKDGKIVLIDFGAVKGISALGVDPQGQTSVTVAIGSPGYMPSEQAIGKPKLCSDVYAVGMTAIQSLTGVSPDRLKEDPDGKWIWRNYAQVSDRLANIIDTMVHPYFSQRYPSAAEALQALLPLSPPTPPPPPPDPDPQPHQSSPSPIPPTVSTPSISPTVTSSPAQPPPFKKLILIGGACLAFAGLFGITLTQQRYQSSFRTPSTSVTTSSALVEDLPIKTITGHSQLVLSVAISPDGLTLVSGSRDKTIKIWNLRSGNLLRTLGGHTSDVNSVAISRDGQTLISGSGDHTIQVWNLNNGTLLRTLSGHADWVTSVAISRDGQTLVSSGGRDRTIKIWNLSNGTLLRTLSVHTDSVNSVAISPNGQTLMSGNSDHTIKIWNLNNGTLLRTLSGHTDSVSSVAISPNGQTLVSGSSDNTIKVWNLSSGNLLHTFSGNIDSVNSVAISPDGKTVVSGGNDYSITVWDLNNGTRLRTLSGHTTYVSSVAISPDGQTLVSGSYDNTIKVWQMPK